MGNWSRPGEHTRTTCYGLWERNSAGVRVLRPCLLAAVKPESKRECDMEAVEETVG